jgi:hypothetical protein
VQLPAVKLGEGAVGDDVTAKWIAGGGLEMSHGVTTEVDIDSLAQAVAWLDGLKNYIQDRLLPETAKLLLTGGQTTQIFGELQSTGTGQTGGPGVADKHHAYVDATISSCKSVAQSLQAASRATQNIVKNYKDVEHNNAVTARTIEGAFASASGGGTAPGGATYPASGPTGPTDTSRGAY